MGLADGMAWEDDYGWVQPEEKTMNNIKGFSWDGIDEKYTWVAQDYSGDIYVFSNKPVRDSAEQLWDNEDDEGKILDCKYMDGYSRTTTYIANWDELCFPREEQEVQGNPSEFSKENFEAYIDSLTGSHRVLAQSSIKEFEHFLNSRKQAPQEIRDAITLLEKSGYTISLDKDNV